MTKLKPLRKITCLGMLRVDTPIENYLKQYGLMVKREDLACPPPGPPFSKTRGVYARVKSRPEEIIGVLDTVHSQAGHAVARACQVLGKECYNFYPVYKKEILDPRLLTMKNGLRLPQVKSYELGARLKPLHAGRSCILFHQAKKAIEAMGGYMMPNALKLEESVTETAKEVPDLSFDRVIIPASSGTIAAGVILGFLNLGRNPWFIVHLGYSRSADQVRAYIEGYLGRSLVKSGKSVPRIEVIDEGYAYKDTARKGPSPPWPCNPYYDLKAFRWHIEQLESNPKLRRVNTLFWNIG